tara:strand:- start:113 stop:2074 length:1962 start_codon:yes stop_codon:yes gene_type:complete
MNPFQKLLNSFGTSKQAKNAISPNQPKQRVFRNLQRNEDVNVSKVNQAANLADAEIQNQVAKNNIPAPPTDQGINIASSQLPDGIPVDQAERVANGQGSLKASQNRQNAGLPPNVGGGDGSSVNNLSSSNIPPDGLPAQRFLQSERQKIKTQLQELGKPSGPGRVDQELAKRVSLGTASSYGSKYTKRAQALDLYATGYGGDAFAKSLNVPSVQITGEQVPTMPSKSFTYSEDVRRLTSELMDPEKGGKLQKLETKYQNLMKLKDQYKSLGGQTSREALNEIDYQLEQIENIYAKANVKRTGLTGAPYIDETSNLSLKVPASSGIVAPQIAQNFAAVRADQAAYQQRQLENLRTEMGLYKTQERRARQEMESAKKAKDSNLFAQKELERNQAIAKQQKIYVEPRNSKGVKAGEKGKEGVRIKRMREKSQQMVRDNTKMSVILSPLSSEYKRAHAQTSPISGVKYGISKDGKMTTTDMGDSEMLINSATVEMRAGRRMIDAKEKGGAGRKSADFAGGEMGVEESTSQAFLQDLLNAQQRSNTGTIVNRRDPNLYYTKGRRSQTQSTFRDYDVDTGGPPKTSADDRTQTGSVKDIYGIRQSGDNPDSKRMRPTQIPPSKTPLDIRQNVSDKEKEIIKRSLEISEDRRRARIEGRR